MFGLVLASSSAYAGIVSTWNFDGGSPAFGSSYTEWWESGYICPNGNMNEGKYSIVDDSSTVHEAFKPAFHGHTTGSDNFMLVNGYDGVGGADPAFFTIDLSGLVQGQTYAFSFFAANAYGGTIPCVMPINPSELGVKLVDTGAYIDTFQLPTTLGAWQQYSVSFVAPGPGGHLGVYDLNRELWGNDFAFDDAAIHAPEPSAWTVVSVGLFALFLLLRRIGRA